MKKALKFIIPAVLGLGIVLAILFARDTFHQTRLSIIYRDLSDAFTVPGLVMAGFGVLIFASNGGAFHMLKFGFIKLADLFKKDLTKVKYRTFYDYQKAQEDKKQSFAHLLIVGLAMVVVAVVFLCLYYSVKETAVA